MVLPSQTTGEKAYDISQWYDLKPVKIGWLAILGRQGVFLGRGTVVDLIRVSTL